MGMTIDEDVLVELFKESKMPIDKAIETIANIASHRRNILNSFEREACANAINTMRKYQKIKNIICKWEDGLYDDEGVSHVEVLDMISNEVNGDGNVD